MTLTNDTTEATKDILLIGLGSIGSIYAYLLERSGKARITAVARSNFELYATTATGVTLDTERFGRVNQWRPYRVVKSQPEALDGDVHYDFCIICTKCLPDIIPTTKLVGEAIKSGKVGAWSLMQNGLEVEKDLYEATKHLEQPVISSCAWIGIMSAPDGQVVSWKGKDVLVSGLYPPLDPIDQAQTRTFTTKEQAALSLWRGLLEDGDADVYIEDRMNSIRYSKNVLNAVWSSIQGLMRTTPDAFQSLSEAERAPVKALIREVVDTGFRSGLLREGMIQYPGGQKSGNADDVADHAWSEIFNTACAKAKAGLPPHKMSMLIDIEMGRPFEVEVISGGVLRIAQSCGVSTPLLAYSYALLKGLQDDFVRTQGVSDVTRF